MEVPYDRGVRVEKLGCELDGRQLLADLDFDVGDDALALLGPSGAGKSLMLRCILGLAPARTIVRGALIFADGRRVGLDDVTALARLRGRVSTLLPQAAAASLDPMRRVEAQLRELLRMHGNDGDSPTSLLRLVGLDAELALRHPHALSGGQAQRVALALALACRPAVLLADEPTASLDNLAQAQLLDTLRVTCTARAIRLVLVTHDLALRERGGAGFILGVSTHDLTQVRASAGLPVDYIGFGPVLPTRSKAQHEPSVGFAGLSAACVVARHPVVAIGGLDAEGAVRAASCGAAMVATIGALVAPAAGEVRARVVALATALAAIRSASGALGS